MYLPPFWRADMIQEGRNEGTTSFPPALGLRAFSLRPSLERTLPLPGGNKGNRAAFQSHASPRGVFQNVSVSNSRGTEREHGGMFAFTFSSSVSGEGRFLKGASSLFAAPEQH